ncbi:HEPN domain-containing protein [Sandarakinorhabdus sp. DWP1-3-1]|uniref:HEPN domain-containing protein n=1 Tax=Sandarakinorhabdus sp. DWP1-3-1 TaxID=2804627 RepID=UPI003CEF5F97
MDLFVPASMRGVTAFRADLAGMLVVSIAAAYESCVKDTMITHAARFNVEFENFTAKNYEKLNSRISVKDLKNYTKMFDPTIHEKFRLTLVRRKALMLRITGKSIESEFENILSWRHAFAHAGTRVTTIEEAANTHRIARIVIFSFFDAFHN